MSNSYDTELETPEFERLSSLSENLVYRLPGCSDVMIRKTLQQVYRDFCRRSCCLYGRRHLTLTAGQRSIPVPAINGGIVDSIARVLYNGRIVKAPRDFSIANGSSLVIFLAPHLVPSEDCDDENLPDVEITTIEIPALNSEEVPSGFIARYGEYLCNGVLSQLMSQTGKTWSDGTQASMEKIAYENAINEARIRHYAGDMVGNGNLEIVPDGEILI